MDKYLLTGNKLLWHMDRLNEWMKGNRISPIKIDMGITTGCNAACKFCFGQFIGKSSMKNAIHLDKKILYNLFKDCRDLGIKAISLAGEGENTIHPDFYEILEYAKEFGIDLGIATNMIKLNKNRVKEFLEAFVWIKINLSASNRKTYKEIHGVDVFDDVIENIRGLVRVKREYNLKTTIGMQIVVIGDNTNEIIPLAKLGKELGVDYFVAKPAADIPNRKFDIPFEKLKKMEETFKEAEKYGSSEYSVVIKRSKFECGEEHPFKTCYGTQFSIALDARGNVAPCAHLLGYKSEVFNVGNLHNNSLKEIIESDRYWDVQKLVQELDVDKECETNCLHYYMCQLLEGLKEKPNHINFV